MSRGLSFVLDRISLVTVLAAACSGAHENANRSGTSSAGGGYGNANAGSSLPETVAQAGANSAPTGVAGFAVGGAAGSAADALVGASHIKQPAGWDDAMRVARARDESDDPNVFETHLTAEVKEVEILPGLSTSIYSFGGKLPGPEIRVRRGDRVIVHFTNALPEDTTIHWHGLRIPNAMDGVPGITQDPVKPGETFTYDFVVPDAGTFWYHPHVRSAAQVGFGMYGSFIVEDPDEPADLGDELTLVLSDISLDEQGKLLPADSGSRTDDVFGREGNVLLVNGKVEPILRARSGRRQRWRLLNAARTRYFELALEGQRFTRFAGDCGMSEHSVEMSTLVITPGERMEVVFDPDVAPKSTLKVMAIPTDRGFGSTIGRTPLPLFSIEIDPASSYAEAALPSLGRVIEPMDMTIAKTVPLDMSLGLDALGYTVLGINGVSHADAPPLTATIGETQLWKISDSTGFAHPFHLHGYSFQVLATNGKPPAVREWKDTVNIPAKGNTDIAVRFDDRPGTWMLHCHILDHADLGMMTSIQVTEPGESSASHGAMH
jgi:FtsP/CotA-like multicopper oxidase with cupredoxin domain